MNTEQEQMKHLLLLLFSDYLCPKLETQLLVKLSVQEDPAAVER